MDCHWKVNQFQICQKRRKPAPPPYNAKARQQPLDIYSKELLPQLDRLNSTVMLAHPEKVAAQVDII